MLFRSNGVCGFRDDMDYYKGVCALHSAHIRPQLIMSSLKTLFRLPLRNDSQAYTSKLSSEAISPERVDKLMREYGAIAPQSLLNIGVRSITASVRDNRGVITRLWSAKASHRDIPLAGQYLTCREVNVTVNDASGKRYTDSWHVVAEHTDVSALPPEFNTLPSKHKLRDISIALAGLTSSGDTEPPTYRLYSRLPLPTLTTLPVHVDASFILAEDRRSIRFDESGQVNLESRYNCWLLSCKIPALYGHLLESWPQEINTDIWPGAVNKPDDPISRVVIEGFYNEYFATSCRKFCLSMAGDKLSPQDSIFLDTEKVAVKKIFEAIAPANFVQLPQRLRRKVLALEVMEVDAEAIHDVISREPEAFSNAFTEGEFNAEEIGVLLTRMAEETAESLLGLTILPLADNSLGLIGPPSETTFFVSRSLLWKPWSLFPDNRFIHPQIDCQILVRQDSYNIRDFSAEDAVGLMEDILPREALTTLDEVQQDWVTEFWDILPKSNMVLDSLSDFPLVRTDRDHTYVSLGYCESPKVLAYRPADDELSWLGPMVKDLGATMVTIEGSPDAMRDAVKDTPALLLDFENVLRFLESLPPSWVQRFVRQEDVECQHRFSAFALSHIRSLRVLVRDRVVDIQHREVARRLPIWEASKNGRSLFVAASDHALKVLPPSVALNSAERFLGRNKAYTEYDARLRDVLDVAPIEFTDFVHTLSVPKSIQDSEVLQAYKKLLVDNTSLFFNSGVKMMIPNTHGVLVDPGSLFAHNVPLFLDVFGEDSDRFVHPTFREALGLILRSWGMHDCVDFTTFKICATVVDTGTTEDTDRAASLYQYYNDQLWQNVLSREDLWEELEELRFIPRAHYRRRYRFPTFSPEDYASELPSVISPNEVLRPEFESVAWTQLAPAHVEPSERLLLANLQFGIPAEDEVVSCVHCVNNVSVSELMSAHFSKVEHLRQLVRIADDHPNDRNVLSDLIDTYRWLASHKEACQAMLLDCQEEPLFLNVDDTKSQWKFSPAQQILFNGHDEGHWQSARLFLLQFKDLLLSVGSKEIKQVVLPPLELSPAEEVLVKLRSALNKQRLEGTLTDVELLSSDDVSFHAHRAILAASTQHFEAMFGHDWREHEGQVQTEESADVLKHALGKPLPLVSILCEPSSCIRHRIYVSRNFGRDWFPGRPSRSSGAVRSLGTA